MISLKGELYDYEQSTALIDIAPTLLESAGIEVPYFMQGKSLLPILRGEVDYKFHKDVVLSEFHDSVTTMKGADHRRTAL